MGQGKFLEFGLSVGEDDGHASRPLDLVEVTHNVAWVDELAIFGVLYTSNLPAG